jgi:muconate cycloisomerase
MQLASVDLFHILLPFKRGFAHASAHRVQSDNVLVRCRTTAGVTGWGETIAREYVTGETTEGTIARLAALPRSAWEQRFDTPAAISGAFAQDLLADANVASCGVEVALLDAFARARGEPLYRVLASAWPDLASVRAECSLRYGGPFGLGSTRDALATAVKLRLYGFGDVKLKVATDLKADATRLEIARRILGRSVDLRVDANEAWSFEHALAMAPLLRRHRISAIEQPFPKTMDGRLGDLHRATGLPIIVDESLCSETDARSLAATGAKLLFAVKLAKLGGFRRTLGVVAVAASEGMGVQIGCQVGESGILSAAGRHLAAVCPNLRYLEGSHDRFLLAGNVIAGDITFGRRGLAPVLTGPGLGVDVVEAEVERWAVKRIGLYRRVDRRGSATFLA